MMHIMEGGVAITLSVSPSMMGNPATREVKVESAVLVDFAVRLNKKWRDQVSMGKQVRLSK